MHACRRHTAVGEHVDNLDSRWGSKMPSLTGVCSSRITSGLALHVNRGIGHTSCERVKEMIYSNQDTTRE